MNTHVAHTSQNHDRRINEALRRLGSATPPPGIEDRIKTRLAQAQNAQLGSCAWPPFLRNPPLRFRSGNRRDRMRSHRCRQRQPLAQNSACAARLRRPAVVRGRGVCRRSASRESSNRAVPGRAPALCPSPPGRPRRHLTTIAKAGRSGRPQEPFAGAVNYDCRSLVGGDCFYDHVQHCQHYGANKSCAKTRDIKARNNGARHLQHDRVDHQEEQAKGENPERQGDELEQQVPASHSAARSPAPR